MSCNYILSMASGVWQDLGQPSDVTPSYISGWFVEQSNIGKLNNYISTCFSGASGCISPALQNEEQSIYSEIYKSNYYGKKVTENLGAGGIQWTEIREGDSVIRRGSPTEVAKVYAQMKKSTDEGLIKLVSYYKINMSTPRTVDYQNP